MQILHPFTFTHSAQQYAEEISTPDRCRPDHCPQCQAQLPLIAHGFYSRTLVEAGFDKVAVRAAAKIYGLPVWDKPAFACLGSRFPVGTRVTLTRIRQVQRLESHLRLLGLKQFRARWHELEGQPLARIEVDPATLASLVAPGVRESIVEVAKAEGFRWVTLDLQGYQQGGLSLPAPGSGTGSST